MRAAAAAQRRARSGGTARASATTSRLRRAVISWSQLVLWPASTEWTSSDFAKPVTRPASGPGVTTAATVPRLSRAPRSAARADPRLFGGQFGGGNVGPVQTDVRRHDPGHPGGSIDGEPADERVDPAQGVCPGAGIVGGDGDDLHAAPPHPTVLVGPVDHGLDRPEDLAALTRQRPLGRHRDAEPQRPGGRRDGPPGGSGGRPRGRPTGGGLAGRRPGRGRRVASGSPRRAPATALHRRRTRPARTKPATRVEPAPAPSDLDRRCRRRRHVGHLGRHEQRLRRGRGDCLVGVLHLGDRQATGWCGHGQQQRDRRRHRDQGHGPAGPPAGAPVGQIELTPHCAADAPQLLQRLTALPAAGDVIRHPFDRFTVEVGAQLQRGRVTAVHHRLAPNPSWERWRATRLRAAWRRDITVPRLTACTSAISA